LENVEEHSPQVEPGFPVLHVFKEERRIPVGIPPPLRHGSLPRVVGGYGAEIIAAIFPDEAGKVRRTQCDIGLRPEQVLPAGLAHLLLPGDFGCRARHELHQPHRTRRREGVELELRLLPDY
jgi:hypothetical protein